MEKNELTNAISAPRFDELLQRAKEQPIITKRAEKEILMNIREKMKTLTVCGTDDYRHFWFSLDRGKISEYGSFATFRKEGVVDSREKFNEMWLGEYPDETCWYHFETNEYNGEYYFYVDSELTFQISKTKPDYFANLNNSKLLNLMDGIVATYSQWIVNDNEGYNRFINRNLSYHRRTGKILRKNYWEINPDEKKSITKGLTKSDIEILKKIVALSGDEVQLSPLKSMTAGKFFEYCRMGYDANGYFKKNPDISNVQAYSAFSDGRDEGLRQINPDSEEEFQQWFFDRGRIGGHPWEVCRGGNSTHISLFIFHDATGWSLSLAGSSCTRVNETVKFAIALYRHQIPFKLNYAAEILDMVTGEDYIGIVPKEIFPRYCHSLFDDDEDIIIDYMNLGWDDTERIIAASKWYPVEIK